MNIINIEHISKLFGDKLIFDDASFGLQEGDKVGIVGINGTVFELRGAVQFTVHKLACSQASIYRYIKKVKSQTE